MGGQSCALESENGGPGPIPHGGNATIVSVGEGDPERPRPALERALRFIADNLDRPLTVAEIARAAHMSEYHFHRVFHAVLGESVGRYVTRRTLETAALRLAYDRAVPVTTVALESGYSSTSNFSKAFSAHFGCSPTAIRNPASVPRSVGRLTSRYGKAFRPADLYTLPPDPDPGAVAAQAEHWDARVRFEECAERAFVCLAAPSGYDVDAITGTWRELIGRAVQLGITDATDVDAWGIPHDSPDLTAPERCRYHACIPCPETFVPAEPLFRSTMKAGRYAVFRYEGDVAGVGDAYRSIYSCWFQRGSVTPADFVPVDHYVGDFPEDGRVELELWLRVRPARA